MKLSQTVLKLPENKVYRTGYTTYTCKRSCVIQPAFFLALFAYNLKLELMLAILAVSIELELYLDHELPMVYCYMEFLLRNQCENYEQVASMQSVLNGMS